MKDLIPQTLTPPVNPPNSKVSTPHFESVPSVSARGPRFRKWCSPPSPFAFSDTFLVPPGGARARPSPEASCRRSLFFDDPLEDSWPRGLFDCFPAVLFLLLLRFVPATLGRRARGMQKVPPPPRCRSCPSTGGHHFADFPGFDSCFGQNRKVNISLSYFALFWPLQGWVEPLILSAGVALISRLAFLVIRRSSLVFRFSPVVPRLSLHTPEGYSVPAICNTPPFLRTHTSAPEALVLDMM